MNITTTFSIWLSPICFALGVVFAYLLYRRSQIENKSLQIFLLVLRTIVVSLIAFFLLSPVLLSISKKIEKPIIAIAIDNSESIILLADSSMVKEKLKLLQQNLTNELEEKFALNFFSFGEKVKETTQLSFHDKTTDFYNLTKEIENTYVNSNLAAVIVASDGIQNQGPNPLNVLSKRSPPFYCIALGDTSIKSDGIVSQVNVNKLAYFGNEFPVEVSIKANKLLGKNASINIQRDGKIIATQAIVFNSADFFQTFKFKLNADKKGTSTYKVVLSNSNNELTYLNNSRQFYVDVIETKEKILILGAVPHPDLVAIKAALENNENSSVEVAIADQFNGNLKEFSLLILHQLPSTTSKKILDDIVNSKIPYLIILGSNTNYSELSNYSKPFVVKVTKESTNDAVPIINNDFNLFTLSEETKQRINKFPPLIVPFGTYLNFPSHLVLAKQKIGTVNSEFPIIAFSENTSSRIGIICGEGLWRWRMTDYAVNNSAAAFDELFRKTTQLLSEKIDRNKFRINCDKKFLENEAVVFSAEVYNESYEPVLNAEISLSIRDSKNKIYPYVFSKNNGSYKLDVGTLNPGEYLYKAVTSYGNKNQEVNGKITVEAIQLESSNLIADHQFLKNMSDVTNGKLFYLNNVKALIDELKNKTEFKTISFQQKELTELINLKWLFILIIVLICIEWFVRKYNGLY